MSDEAKAMKSKASEAKAVEPVAVKPKAVKPKDDSVYSLGELIEGHKAFDRPKECVAAALRSAGIKRATVDEAKAIIDKFMRKVIK